VTTFKNTQTTKTHKAQGINFLNDVLQGLKVRLFADYYDCQYHKDGSSKTISFQPK
jgi:hypothetical protein